MKYIKFGLIFLGILLLVFMVQGMLFGMAMFFYVIRLMVITSVIGLFVYLYFKFKK